MNHLQCSRKIGDKKMDSSSGSFAVTPSPSKTMATADSSSVITSTSAFKVSVTNYGKENPGAKRRIFHPTSLVVGSDYQEAFASDIASEYPPSPPPSRLASYNAELMFRSNDETHTKLVKAKTSTQTLAAPVCVNLVTPASSVKKVATPALAAITQAVPASAPDNLAATFAAAALAAPIAAAGNKTIPALTVTNLVNPAPAAEHVTAAPAATPENAATPTIAAETVVIPVSITENVAAPASAAEYIAVLAPTAKKVAASADENVAGISSSTVAALVSRNAAVRKKTAPIVAAAKKTIDLEEIYRIL